MASAQLFSEDDALDYVVTDSVVDVERESDAAFEQQEFVAPPDVSHDASQSEGDDDEQGFRYDLEPKRSAQSYRSANEYEVEAVEEDTSASLATKSDDSKHVRAFKIVCSEAIRRNSASFIGNGMLFSHGSSPSNCDYRAEICVAAKSALPLHAYRVFLVMFDTDFERWQEVSQHLRELIMARGGKMFLKRGIVTHRGNVNEYFQQRGGSLFQRTRFVRKAA